MFNLRIVQALKETALSSNTVPHRIQAICLLMADGEGCTATICDMKLNPSRKLEGDSIW